MILSINKTVLVAAALAGAALLLSGCENARSALGLDKTAPDEFAVVTRAPLSLPPDYGLRPPAPGAQRPQEATPRNKARQILVGNAGRRLGEKAAVASGRFSPGEAALLARAGALNPDPMIRRKVNRESKAIAGADKGILNKIIFWQKPAKPGVVVDPAKESRRLREASALGKPLNKGKVPVIERKERGLLEGLFF